MNEYIMSIQKLAFDERGKQIIHVVLEMRLAGKVTKTMLGNYKYIHDRKETRKDPSSPIYYIYPFE